MNNKSQDIKELILFMVDVYNGIKIGRRNGYFFKSKKELKVLWEAYKNSFYTQEEAKKEISYNYNIIKDLSFETDKKFYYVRDLTSSTKPRYTEEHHKAYAKRVHSVLFKEMAKLMSEDDGLSGLDEDNNPYPQLFVSGEVYLRFLEYTSNFIIDWYLDYSYLKKRLEHEKLIYRTRDNEFIQILHREMALISKKQYDKYSEFNQLYSLKKSTKVDRENNFNNTFLGLIS